MQFWSNNNNYITIYDHILEPPYISITPSITSVQPSPQTLVPPLLIYSHSNPLESTSTAQLKPHLTHFFCLIHMLLLLPLNSLVNALSRSQAILLAIGLQHKTVDEFAKEMDLPASQVLGLFNRIIKKIVQVVVL